MLQETAVNKTLSGGICVQCEAEDSRQEPSTLWSHWAVHPHSSSPRSFPAPDRITLLSSLPVDVATWLASHNDTGAGECMSLPGGAFESQWVSPQPAAVHVVEGPSPGPRVRGVNRGPMMGVACACGINPVNVLTTSSPKKEGRGGYISTGCVWGVCMFIRNFADIRNAIYK